MNPSPLVFRDGEDAVLWHACKGVHLAQAQEEAMRVARQRQCLVLFVFNERVHMVRADVGPTDVLDVAKAGT